MVRRVDAKPSRARNSQGCLSTAERGPLPNAGSWGAEVLSGEGTPETHAGAEQEVSVWAFPRVAVGASGLLAGSGSSEGFASLRPATRGRFWRGARSRKADALRAQ